MVRVEWLIYTGTAINLSASHRQLRMLKASSRVAAPLPYKWEAPNEDILEMRVLTIFTGDHIHSESYTQGRASAK